MVKQIAEAAELVQLDSGDVLHRANQPMTSVYLVVHGRLKQAVVDLHGKTLLHRYMTRGSQFGALGAAQGRSRAGGRELAQRDFKISFSNPKPNQGRHLQDGKLRD